MSEAKTHPVDLFAGHLEAYEALELMIDGDIQVEDISPVLSMLNRAFRSRLDELADKPLVVMGAEKGG